MRRRGQPEGSQKRELGVSDGEELNMWRYNKPTAVVTEWQ